MVCAGGVWRDKTLVFKDRFKSIALSENRIPLFGAMDYNRNHEKAHNPRKYPYQTGQRME